MEYQILDAEKLTCKECGDTYTLCRCRHDVCRCRHDVCRCRHDVCTKNDDGRCGNDVAYPPEDWKYFPGISDKFYRV